MTKIRYIKLLLILALSICCNQKYKSQPVIIGYQEIALYRHLFTAVEKSYFNQEGVSVEIKPFVSANSMIEGMVAGKLDGTGLTNLQVALTVEAKDPGRLEFVNLLVWGKESYPDYILARPNININTLKDLEGHTVGLHPGSAVKAFSRAVFQHFGVDLNKVSFIELEPAIMQSAILADRVHALYCMDPVATNLIQSKQANVLLNNPMQYIFRPPVPISGTALSKKFLQKRPEDARRVIKAIEKAIKYMREPGHENEIAGYIAKYTPITPEMSKKMNISEYWTTSEIDRERVQALADKFLELGIVDKAVDVNNLLASPDFLKRK